MNEAENSLGTTVESLFIGQLLSLFIVPIRLSTREYAASRWLGPEVTAKPGFMDVMETPFMLFPMDCLDDPDIPVIIGKKSAQIAWTTTINTFVERRIVNDPQPIIIAFPAGATCNKFANEKFRPMVQSSPKLLELIGDPYKSCFDFYKFPGGFIKFVTAGSTTALKSTSAPILIVEEPDDLKEDLKGQGDALAIFQQRLKSYVESKLIFAGTPSEEGFSKVDVAYEQSNKMVFLVPCHVCGEFHELSFDNLKYIKYPNGHIDKTYGEYDPTTAYYQCPHCFSHWDDAQKKLNVIEAVKYHNFGWVATAESHMYGFAFCELMSSMPGSNLVTLARNKLEAEVEYEKGKDGKLKSFTNNSIGIAYSPKSGSLTIKELKAKRIAYEEMVVPANGLVLTAGIDVQHNRFAIVIRAWGRGGNSWLVYWGEIYGYVRDPEDSVWQALTEMMLAKIPHALSRPDRPISLPISAISIDSGDGNTTQLVYSWVLGMLKYNSYVYATKGSSDNGAHKKEIFTVPTDPDAVTDKGKRKKVAETLGIHVYIVGVQQAKDEVLRKLSLTGDRDRSYHYSGVREDYEDQLLSNKKRRTPAGDATRYELVMGKRDEVLDCEVLALHASRALFIHTWTEKHWQQVESSIIQTSVIKGMTATADYQNVTKGIN